LVIITSAGIYGFLSSAYQETATKVGVIDKEVAVLELKRDRFIENRDFFLEEKKNLDQSIKDLRNGLSNNVIQYKDEDTGEIITTTSSSTRKVLQSQLDEAITNRNDISIKLEQTTDSITNLDLKILDVESGSELSGELGPLKYISELTDTPMNKVVNYLLIILVLVFDPLAIALVISANFLFEKLIKRNKKEDNINDTNDLLDNVDIINDEVKPEINTKRLVYKRRDDKG